MASEVAAAAGPAGDDRVDIDVDADRQELTLLGACSQVRFLLRSRVSEVVDGEGVAP